MHNIYSPADLRDLRDEQAEKEEKFWDEVDGLHDLFKVDQL